MITRKKLTVQENNSTINETLNRKLTGENMPLEFRQVFEHIKNNLHTFTDEELDQLINLSQSELMDRDLHLVDDLSLDD